MLTVNNREHECNSSIQEKRESSDRGKERGCSSQEKKGPQAVRKRDQRHQMSGEFRGEAPVGRKGWVFFHSSGMTGVRWLGTVN